MWYQFLRHLVFAKIVECSGSYLVLNPPASQGANLVGALGKYTENHLLLNSPPLQGGVRGGSEGFSL